MTTQKHPYTAPEADLLVVRFEENFLGSGDVGNPGDPGMPGSEILDPGAGFEFIF